MQSYLAEKPPTSGHEDQKEKAGGAACSTQTSSLKPITAAITTPNSGPFQYLYEVDPTRLTTSSRFQELLARNKEAAKRYRERIKMEKMEMRLKVDKLQAENDRLMRLNLQLQENLLLGNKAALENNALLQDEKDASELKPRTGCEKAKAGEACSTQPFAHPDPVKRSNNKSGPSQALDQLYPTRHTETTSPRSWRLERKREIDRQYWEMIKMEEMEVELRLKVDTVDKLQAENDRLMRLNHQLPEKLPLANKAALENNALLPKEEDASELKPRIGGDEGEKAKAGTACSTRPFGATSPRTWRLEKTGEINRKYMEMIDEEEHLESSEITDHSQVSLDQSSVIPDHVSSGWQKLERLRDLLLSVSSYPCVVVDKTKLQWWTNKALQITRKITQEHGWTSNMILARWQLGVAAEGGSYFHDNALRSDAHSHLHHPFLMEIHRVLPKAMLHKIYHHDAADGTNSSCRGKLPLPADILELAVSLAVRHILCSLCNGDITRIRIRGRCKERIVKAIQHHPALPSNFQHVLRFSGSFIKSMIKVRKVNELQTTTHLQGSIPCNSSKGLLKPMLLVEDADEENATGSLEILLDPPLNMNMMNTISGAAMVFTSELTADMEIRMEDHLLSWHLFCEHVGDMVLSPDFQRLAVSIVTECDGHLLAVILIARFLKNVSDIRSWERSLQRLNMQLSFGVEGISVVMINTLLLIWEQLDDSKRQCLRHHALNFNGEENHRPDIIVAYWVDQSLVLTPEEGNCVLQDLLDAFLLQTLGPEIVVLHEETQKIIVELLRDRDTLLLSQCGLGLTEPPEEEEWNVREIHLTDNNISELPESPNCPDLISLNLQKNYDLTTIPSKFFEQMPVLQILDLSYTNVKSFPESLPRLVSLRELFLRGCELIMELPTEVGQLQNLEKLDLDETQIIELPETIGNLTKLKFLRVSFYGYGNQSKKELQRETIIRPGTISNLLELTELSIDVDPDDERWEAVAKTIIEEACRLERLTHLRLYLPNLEILWNRSMGGTSLVQYPLSHFRFTVGHHKDRLISRVPQEVERRFEAWEKCFKFINGKDISATVKRSLKEVVSFFLDSHASAQSLSEFGIENVMQLKFCLLAECHQIQTIIDGKDVPETLYLDRFLPSAEEHALPYLQYLTVYYMKNLESIWRGPTQKHCLSNLRLLALHRCPKLSIIFSPDLIAGVQKLEELVIEDCPEVTSLVISRDEGTLSSASVPSIAEYLLPSLKRMSLLFLPKLDRMSNGLLIAPRLEKVGIYYCRQLRNISTIETSSQELNVKGEVTWWNALEWENQQLRSRIKFKEIERKRDLISQLVDDKFIVLAYKQEC